MSLFKGQVVFLLSSLILASGCSPSKFSMDKSMMEARKVAGFGRQSMGGSIGGYSGSGSGSGTIGGVDQPNPTPTATVIVTPTPTPTATVLPPAKANGACGDAQGKSSRQAPTSGLCAVGNPSSVATYESSFGWSCSGVSGGRAASCQATVTVDGKCGSSSGQSHLFPPGGGLCEKGEPTAVSSNSSGFIWSCRGLNGGGAVNCGGSISSAQPTDIPLWQRCQQMPRNDNWSDKYIEAHDPENLVFELRRSADLSVVCRIDKVAIGTLSKYGRPDVASIDLTVVKEKCGALLDRDGGNDYRVFIQDPNRYKEMSTATYISGEDNLLLMGASSGSGGQIGGYHEDNNPSAPGFRFVRYTSKSPWCLAKSFQAGSAYSFIDCGDKVNEYLQVTATKNGSPITPLPGGYYTRDGQVWSFALSIIDSNSNMQVLDPNLSRVAKFCQAMGSPLVIDTRDNVSEAIPMSSIEKGVEFDLLGDNSYPYAHA
ncbi:MAG: hypothetical protein RJB66_798, partial [Pseudomonadota bacterium]